MAVARRRLNSHAVEIGIAYVLFDIREVNGRFFAAENAGALALGPVVAHKRAGQAHGVVLKEDPAGVLDAALAKEGDDLRD